MEKKKKREGSKDRVTIEINIDLIADMKIEAIKQRRSLASLTEELYAKYLKGKNQITFADLKREGK